MISKALPGAKRGIIEMQPPSDKVAFSPQV
jgi:hypothetical protein